MDPTRISELLRPFLRAEALARAATLSSEQLRAISTYIDLLLRWNARINLTAVREPDAIVTRHFGESLFLAAYLLPRENTDAAVSELTPPHVLDLGSGAGFPGLPLKVYAPRLRLTLLESNQKKAAFLNEVVRSVGLSGVQVINERIEARRNQEGKSTLPVGIQPAGLVTMRAVEHFESALNTAATLLRCNSATTGGGKLALLIGLTQATDVPRLVPDFSWASPLKVPQSQERVLLIGQLTRAPASG